MACSNCGKKDKYWCFHCSKPLCGSCRRGKPLGWCRTCREEQELKNAIMIVDAIVSGAIWLYNKVNAANQSQGDNKW